MKLSIDNMGIKYKFYSVPLQPEISSVVELLSSAEGWWFDAKD